MNISTVSEPSRPSSFVTRLLGTEREYAHADKISAMNAFEALGDDDVNAE